MISYGKLWILLEKKGMKKTDLREILSPATVAKLGKNENINSEVIGKICKFLNCQPGDIMEYVDEEKVQKVVEEFGAMQQVMVNSLKEKGVSEEDFQRLMSEVVPKMMGEIFNGGNPLEKIMEEAMKQKEDTEE